MRKGFWVILFCILVIFNASFASQLRYYPPLEANIELQAFSLEKERNNIKLQRIENIINYTIQFDKEILNLSGYRESENLAWAIFEVSVDTNIPLRRDLTLSFDMYASQLNLSTDCAYVSLTLTDGENVIWLGYYLGYQLPEWRFLRDYYVSYRVSDTPDMWVRGKRNIWHELVSKNLPLTSSVNIVKATFGILSYHPTPQFPNNRKMQALFNASGNLLFFETSTFVKIPLDSYQFPWNAVFLIIMDIVFFVFTVKLFKTPIKNKKKPTNG